MRIALGQIDVAWKNTSKNKEKCEEFIQKASENKVDMIIFPEMTITGVSNNVPYLLEANEEIVQWFKDRANKYNINICFGYVKEADDKGQNNLLVVSPKKEKIVEYTKIHPFSYANEDKYFKRGEEIKFFNINEMIFSPFICYDLRFPEIFQIASKKAHAVIVIANWPKNRREHWMALLKARAIENQCYVFGVNRVGEVKSLVYSGDSMIIDPLGNVIETISEKEELIIADINLKEVENIREKFNIKNDRREEFYAEFIK
ncbi:carbon-nitrogen family hydrolase [Clostridium ganghwense]|uniref:Carbon-nitrogen family hydrolase n=1 Tax=Clostridium ganghwense TaxID=312089 RepID=A0ABT4CRT6_9CLOT|nr:carbon-nitrogen family hydrolase [Clostridium ganghwense]MCY6371777.1 carbon-nitrogen family hydrolase [Clostridium ganghwense]